MFNALHVVNYNEWNKFSYIFYIIMVQDNAIEINVINKLNQK